VDEWVAWHSSRSAVYHDSTLCRTGNNIEEEYLRPGRGGRRRCAECRRIGDQAGRVEDLPDLTGATFDQVQPDGSIRKFVWGVATAGQQVEGRLTNSEWDSFAKSPFQQLRVFELGDADSTELRLERPGRAIDHWDLATFTADLDRAAALGLNAYRLSVEWSRVVPRAPAWVRSWIRNNANFATEEVAGRQVAPDPLEEEDVDRSALDRYRAMIDAIRAHGMEPWVALNHMSLPRWVVTAPATAFLDDPSAYDETTVGGFGGAGSILARSLVEDEVFRGTLRGWETRATVAAYRQYVRAVVSALPDVRWWLTLNEPIGTMINTCYLAGLWPPAFLGAGRRALRVFRRLIEAHVAAYDVIHEIRPNAQVGCSQWIASVRRAPQTIAQKLFIGDNEAAKNQWEYFHNFYFLDAVVHGHDNPEIWRKTTPEIRTSWKSKLDFVAIQYYRSVYVFHDVGIALACPAAGGRFKGDVKRDPGAPDYLKERLFSDLGWTVEPAGLYEVLQTFHSRYGLPIFITENGIGESEDRNRAPFTVAHLQQVLRAIKDGVDVRGYIHWTIADNWEWVFGYLPSARFGLFTIDRPATANAADLTGLPRHITGGALAYAQIVVASGAAGASAERSLFDPIVRRFGTIDPAGKRHLHPSLQNGGFWLGRWSGERPSFVLFLSMLADDLWTGMLFDIDAQRWSRLSGISWTKSSRDAGLLGFTLPARAGMPALTFSATTRRTPLDGAPDLLGEARGGAGLPRQWEASRALLDRVFKRSAGPGGPTLIRLTRLEPGARWRAGTAERTGAWAPASAVSVAERTGNVRLRVENGPRFTGKLEGDRLVGELDGDSPLPWSGRALPDELPFA
jgi:beta-glucosidase/6-phospho-beta-glucosidase/beta-galactosidase